MKVADIMTDEIVIVKPTEPLAHIRKLLLKHEISRLVVVDDMFNPIGIISKHDIARATSKGGPPWRRRPIDRIPAQRLMTSNIKTIDLDLPVKEVAQIMLSNKLGGLPVIEDNKLVGIITKTDMTRFYAENGKSKAKIVDLMTNNVITVNNLHSLSHVIKTLNKHKIARLVVVGGVNQPVGILTLSDLSFAFLERPTEGIPIKKVQYTRKAEHAGRPIFRHVKSFALLTAEDAMTPNPITINEAQDAVEGADIMIKRGISGLPVLNENDELVGIITKTDFVKGIATLF
ncbi:MAG: CBS domain-containing protein [Euryarchaeota archaeon]|nr:CBS domain-containing protein [Euryarchaeota archaeon]